MATYSAQKNIWDIIDRKTSVKNNGGTICGEAPLSIEDGTIH